ncbi:MAG: LexA family transcriptional regulator [Rickettsiales bacterium]
MEKRVKNRVKQIRESRGLSQETLAEKIGKDRGQISRVESGKTMLSTYWLDMLSWALDCAPKELISDDISGDILMVPVIGIVPGGDLMLAMEKAPEHFIPFHAKSSRKGIVALKVEGNSMSRIIPDGGHVIVDTLQNNPVFLSGQPVVVLRDNGFDWECMFKIYKNNPDRFEPYSLQPGHETRFPEENEWRVFGRVIGAMNMMEDISPLRI